MRISRACRACGICLCCGDHADDYPCCACGNDRVTLTCAYVYGLADGGAPCFSRGIFEKVMRSDSQALHAERQLTGNGNVSAQGSCSLQHSCEACLSTVCRRQSSMQHGRQTTQTHLRPLLRVSINFLTLQSCQAKVALMITLAPRTNTALVHILVAACRQVAAAVSYICL